MGDAEWDPAIARATVNITQYLEQAAEIAFQANAKYKMETGEDSVLAVASETLRSTASHWSVPPIDGGASVSQSLALGEGPGIDMSLIDFSDDFWMTQTFNF